MMAMSYHAVDDKVVVVDDDVDTSPAVASQSFSKKVSFSPRHFVLSLGDELSSDDENYDGPGGSQSSFNFVSRHQFSHSHRSLFYQYRKYPKHS